MARATFGPTGRKIVIDDNPLNKVGGEIGNDAATDSTDSGANGNAESIAGSEHREDSGETGNDFVEVGETVRSSEYIEPGTVAEQPRPKLRKDGTPRKQRGPNKSKQQSSTTQESTNVLSVNLTKILLSMHTMGAALLSEPDLNITEDEAELIAEAVKEVAKAYDFTQIFNPRVQALIDLGIIVMTVHGPRVVKIYHRHNRQPGTVTVLRASQTGD